MSARIVYSTGVGRVCPDCGRAANECACASLRAGNDAVPSRVTARLRIEKQGRAGKVVTVLDGLPNNATFVASLAAELKQACGTGGTVRPGLVELAGDQRDRIRPLLAARGITVKG